MGFGPTIPRYNINRGNSRSTIHLLNSDVSKGEWRIGFYNDFVNVYPRFILILGDANNTKSTFQTINTSNGAVESAIAFGPNSISSDVYYNIDICGDLLSVVEVTPIVASASASASASGSEATILQTANSELIDIVQMDGTNNGFSNVLGDLSQLTSVPGCVTSSLAPGTSGFSDQNVQICVGVLAAVAFLFLILFLVFAALWDQRRSSYYA